MTSSRRAFLKQASAAAVAVGGLAHLPTRSLAATAPDALAPELTDDWLRELAAVAMTEAKQAGAIFADIRINAARAITNSVTYGKGGSHKPNPWIGFLGSFGIRAIVDGAWGFAGGYVLTPERVAQGARAAVQGARLNRPIRPRTLELAPRPVVANGTWTMPVGQDPFTIPLHEQRELLEAVAAPLASLSGFSKAEFGISWRRCTTVFASSDGTLLLQRLAVALPSGTVEARGKGDDWRTILTLPIDGILVGPYGYEALGAATLADHARATAERAIALAQAALTPISTEVGRYDLVFGPSATAGLLRTTIADALSSSRALGYEANGAGTTFAAPPGDMLGKFQVGAPVLTVHGDRTQPKGAATVAWDEEGVAPETYTFVREGIITDYHADRQMATELADWYRTQQQPVRAHGLARRTGDQRPVALIPNLTMEPSQDATTVEDLIRATRRGYYVEDCGGASDQQVLNTQFRGRHTNIRRITNGKLGPYVQDFGFQFITPTFWKGLDGLGGAESAVSQPMVTDQSALASDWQPFPCSTMRTVPMRVRDVNVLNTGRTA